jgi:hypothetical protein
VQTSAPKKLRALDTSPQNPASSVVHFRLISRADFAFRRARNKHQRLRYTHQIFYADFAQSLLNLQHVPSTIAGRE